MPSECLFCKIIAGEIPADVVVDTETTFAFNDISPSAPVHVLVVPKQHIENAHEVDASHAAVLADMFLTAQEVARKTGIAPHENEKGYRLSMNVGKDADNTVGHLHMHVMGGRQLGQLG